MEIAIWYAHVYPLKPINLNLVISKKAKGLIYEALFLWGIIDYSIRAIWGVNF